MDLVYYPVIAITKALFAAQGLRFTMTGCENVPRRGGAVVAINHTGYFDFTHAGNATLQRRRFIRFMAKESIFHHPVGGPLMRGMKHIPVDRAAGGSAYLAAVAALRSGELVGVYPEATISRSFELKAFKPGAARMAQEAGVPILPTIVWGAQRVWTKDHPKRMGRTNTPIFVDIGPPITVGADEHPVAATDRLKTAMAAQLEAVWAAYPPVPEEELVFVPQRMGGRAPTLEQAEELYRQELARKAAKRAAKAAQRSQEPGAGR
ncbi:MAG: 1-acyl-sn-glycerol-3-phosphate acyltransferase [Actinomycetales bacterium]|nr:1-acyl-sn-glycerol-3-phosphate acyltransferase [Actinomycetales bacterium]